MVSQRCISWGWGAAMSLQFTFVVIAGHSAFRVEHLRTQRAPGAPPVSQSSRLLMMPFLSCLWHVFKEVELTFSMTLSWVHGIHETAAMDMCSPSVHRIKGKHECKRQKKAVPQHTRNVPPPLAEKGWCLFFQVESFRAKGCHGL
jgi:hypothetical protein